MHQLLFLCCLLTCLGVYLNVVKIKAEELLALVIAKLHLKRRRFISEPSLLVGALILV